MEKQIQWFPGHMSKALKEIKEKIRYVDLVIEICDARAPFSTLNPEIYSIIKQKPKIMVLSKKDLADSATTKLWIEYFSHLDYIVTALNLNKDNLDCIFAMAKLALKDKIAKDTRRGLKPQPIRALVVGIPNVGKSTFINKMAKRRASNVGNLPGVTKATQLIKVNNEFELMDTPGILWPRFDSEQVGVKLALIGSIKQDILPLSTLAFRLMLFLGQNHPHYIMKRYDVDLPSVYDEITHIHLLEAIGKKRGILKAKGAVEIEKVEELVLKEFRDGILGKASLEHPGDNYG